MSHIKKKPMGRSVDLFVPIRFPQEKRTELITAVHAKLHCMVSCRAHEAGEGEELEFQIVSILNNFLQDEAVETCKIVSETVSKIAGRTYAVVCTDPAGATRHQCDRVAA